MKLLKYLIYTTMTLIMIFCSYYLFITYFFNKQNIVVPNLINMTQTEAQDLLKANKLRYDIKIVSSTNHDTGVVISQYPKPNSIVKNNRIIQIEVNMANSIIMPDVTFMHVNKALSILKNLEIPVKKIDYYEYEGSSDIVLASSPKSDEFVDKLKGATLLVSRKPEEKIVYMPNIIGMNLDQANLLLATLGVQIKDISYVEDLTKKPNTIIVSNPEPNEPIQNGYISVVLNKLDEETLEQDIDKIIRESLEKIDGE